MGVVTRSAIYLFTFLGLLVAVGSALSFLDQDYSEEIALMKAGKLNPYRKFNIWINSFLFSEETVAYFTSKFGDDWGYYGLVYIRDILLGSAVYWITAGLWHITIYNILAKPIFIDKKRNFPTTAIMIDQMILAQASMFLYAGMPFLSELLIENKLTRCYFYLDEIGGMVPAVLYLIIYIACVEVGIYWMHRTLHENKFLYKYVHQLHHKYKSADTLTPWASVAFNPIDGMLQASPYVIFLLFVPMNYFTHLGMLFFTGVWATNIHDSVPADTEPMMGAKYHTYHHTHFHYNYGQFFTICDWFWGTLKLPEKSA